MEGPAAPCDAVSELCFLPADGCIDGRDEESEDDCLLSPSSLREHGKKIINV